MARARFQGYLSGARGSASRTGGAKTGLVALVQGYSIGVRVHCLLDDDGKETFTVYDTGGTEVTRKGKQIAEVKEY